MEHNNEYNRYITVAEVRGKLQSSIIELACSSTTGSGRTPNTRLYLYFEPTDLRKPFKVVLYKGGAAPEVMYHGNIEENAVAEYNEQFEKHFT